MGCGRSAVVLLIGRLLNCESRLGRERTDRILIPEWPAFQTDSRTGAAHCLTASVQRRKIGRALTGESAHDIGIGGAELAGVAIAAARRAVSAPESSMCAIAYEALLLKERRWAG